MFTQRLYEEEIEQGKKYGHLRYTESRKTGSKPCDGYTPLIDERGVEAEIAVAYSLGWFDFIPTVNQGKKVADIGLNLEVRGTAYSSGSLVIKPSDNPDRIYILATYPAFPVFYIIGYIFGFQAEGLGKKDTKGLIWVPQNKLTKIEKLFYEPKYQMNLSHVPEYTTSASSIFF